MQPLAFELVRTTYIKDQHPILYTLSKSVNFVCSSPLQIFVLGAPFIHIKEMYLQYLEWISVLQKKLS